MSVAFGYNAGAIISDRSRRDPVDLALRADMFIRSLTDTANTCETQGRLRQGHLRHQRDAGLKAQPGSREPLRFAAALKV